MAKKAADSRALKRKSPRGWRKGWVRGYGLGSEHGYHLGHCETVLRKIPPLSLAAWDVRVLYIKSGKGLPYSPLDEAVIGALKELVRELVVMAPTQDFAAAAQQYRPDFVLVLDGMNVPLEQIDSIREQGFRTAVWLTDDPYYTDITVPMVSHYDYVFTLESECVPFYQQNGCAQVHHLPFGANVSLFRPKQIPIHYRKDIGFIGSAYWNRVAVFDQIAPYLASKKTYISGIWWNRLRNYPKLASKIALNKWMAAEETACYYNGAKIVINMHRAADDTTFNNNSRLIAAASPNPRTFEICGCGVLQLTDIRSDLTRFYTPDVEIVTYASTKELIQKLDYYLQHEEQRRAIALNALRRTRLEHTYTHRMAQMLRTVFG